jgi:hypothetical protein
MHEIAKVDSTTGFQALDKEIRRGVVGALRQRNVPIRQISRGPVISKGSIENACKEQRESWKEGKTKDEPAKAKGVTHEVTPS